MTNPHVFEQYCMNKGSKRGRPSSWVRPHRAFIL